MKTIYRFLSIIITILMVTACGSDGSKETNNTDVNNNASDTLTSYDSATVVKDAADTSTNYPATFAVKAASGGMMEVELGTLAQQNAQNPRVKAFGAMMVKDHSKANKELMTIATSKTISIPGKVGEEHQNHIDEMKKLKGADFDKHYGYDGQ